MSSNSLSRYRLAQYLAMCGVASRRQASRLIQSGRVTYNQRNATHIDMVDTQQPLPDVMVDGVKICLPEAKVYWLYHKPVGVDCNLVADNPQSLIHLLPANERVFPVGRLDKDSRGLLILTNDGHLTQQLMHPDYQHSKTYHVTVNKPIDEQFLTSMAQGISYEKGQKAVKTQPCAVCQLDANQFKIVLTQGLNRQIRRMCQALGYKVIDLQRVAIGGLSLADLPESQWRHLSPTEVALLTEVS
ncbi:pseudouridine synthase [Shewanella gaetbuli]